MIPLAVYLLQTVGPGLRVVVLGMLLVDLFGIVLTESRGGFLALLATGGLMIWRGSWSRSARLVTITVAVLVFGTIAGKSFWDRMETMWDPRTAYDRTYGGRIELWKTGLVVILTHPWGVGIDGFETAEGLSHGGRGKWSAAHNSFLQVAAELSPAGLILFVLLLGHTIVGLRQVQSRLKKTSQPRLPESTRPGRGAGTLFTGALGRDRLDALATAVRFKNSGSKGSLDGSDVRERRQSVVPLAAALEISLWSFMVGGFFLSQAYSSLLYAVVGLGVVSVRLAQTKEATEQTEPSHPHPWDRHSRVRVSPVWLPPGLARRRPS
jgi:O-antigen ligase